MTDDVCIYNIINVITNYITSTEPLRGPNVIPRYVEFLKHKLNGYFILGVVQLYVCRIMDNVIFLSWYDVYIIMGFDFQYRHNLTDIYQDLIDSSIRLTKF